MDHSLKTHRIEIKSDFASVCLNPDQQLNSFASPVRTLEPQNAYRYVFLEADSSRSGDCNGFCNSGGGWGGYDSADLASKRSFCWNLGLGLSLGKCNTSRGGDWTLHLHRRISRLLSIFYVLKQGKQAHTKLHTPQQKCGLSFSMSSIKVCQQSLKYLTLTPLRESPNYNWIPL